MSRAAGLLLLGFGVAVIGCEKNVKETTSDPAPPPAMSGPTVDTAGTAELKDASGKSLGVVLIANSPSGLVLSGRISGLAPGDYGMHLHSVGKCEGPDFKTAGGHWNPGNKQHGVNNPNGFHAGDLPNLAIGADSTGTVSGVSTGGTFASDSTSLVDADGGSIVLHAGPDDYKSDPAGNSGARIACGVINKKG